MGNKKRKPMKKGLADRVRKGKDSRVTKEKPVNPFELKINKVKHNVLGRKLGKHDKGMPGISRSRALEKRKQHFLIEKQNKGKSNKLIDRRLAENDPTMSQEEKMMQRFALEKQKRHEKASRFLLNDDDGDEFDGDEEDGVLTHRGLSLAQIEKFEDPDSSEDEGDAGRLAAKQIAKEHFGGGMLSNADEDGKKQWMDRMTEMIQDSKKRKYEKQQEKDEKDEMVDRLDEAFRQLRSELPGLQRLERPAVVESQSEEYDSLVHKLRFEARGRPTDRLKTEEEIAKEEKERLDKLEKDRLDRMKGIFPQFKPGASKHVSADSLEEDFAYGDDNDGFTLAYNREGKPILPKQSNKRKAEVDSAASASEDEDEEEGEEGEEEEEEEDGEEIDEEEDNAKEDESSEEESEPESEADGEGKDLPLEGASYSDDDQGEVEGAAEGSKPSVSKPSAGKGKSPLLTAEEKKAIIEKASKEMPYTFKIPKSSDEFARLLNAYTTSDRLIVLDRMKKCNHPSLAEGNKEKLVTLFAHLLDYFRSMALEKPLPIAFLKGLTKHLYSLTQSSPAATAVHTKGLVEQFQDMFTTYCERKGGKGLWPGLDMLLSFKLIYFLYPTSDKRHPVVTPAMLTMADVFTQCPINYHRDIAAGLFLTTVTYEYVSLSKRFMPEVVNFLYNTLYMALPKDKKQGLSPLPPVLNTGNTELLCLNADSAKKVKDLQPLNLPEVLKRGRSLHLNTDHFRMSALHLALQLTSLYAELLKELPAFKHIFQPIARVLDRLSLEGYPKKVKAVLTSLKDTIETQSSQKVTPLTFRKKKVKPIKLYEPTFDTVYDGGRPDRGGTKQEKERKKVQYLIKQETKELSRHYKKEGRFQANEKLKDQLRRDEERKRKVKELYGSLANQEGEFQALKKKKKE